MLGSRSLVTISQLTLPFIQSPLEYLRIFHDSNIYLIPLFSCTTQISISKNTLEFLHSPSIRDEGVMVGVHGETEKPNMSFQYVRGIIPLNGGCVLSKFLYSTLHSNQKIVTVCQRSWKSRIYKTNSLG